VTLIALDPGTTLSGLQRVVETDAEQNGNGVDEPVAPPPTDG